MARDFGRADLVQRLGHARSRLLDPTIRVLVVGEFKQGKSLLINALVNADVCPVDDDVATVVPTIVMHGDAPSATLVYGSSDSMADLGAEHRLQRYPVSLDALAHSVSEQGNPSNEQQLLFAEARLPRKILSGGLALVDTPGVGGASSTHSAATIAALPTADAVLLVSDAAQEYSGPELEFLQYVAKLCPNVACLLTKTDIYPEWRRIRDLDIGHMEKAKLDAPILPVSSVLRRHAVRREDHELNRESGFADLVNFLRTDVVGKAEALSRRSAAHDIASVADHIKLELTTELSALEDPRRNAELVTQLEAAKQEIDDLRKQSARWQVVLSDGITDLSADIDYDLKDRMRRLTREVDNHFEDVDPAIAWDEFVQWLDQRTTSVVAANAVWAKERAEWLAIEVAKCFAGHASEHLPTIEGLDTDSVFEPVPELPDVSDGEISLGQKVVVTMRGSYSGTLMTGLVTSVVTSLAIVNPISLGVGVLLGGRAYREDKANRLKRRQAEAKLAVRRYLEDVVFQVGKQARDSLRRSQRVLRDHFSAAADEMHRSLALSLTAAKKVQAKTETERAERIKELRQQLARVQALEDRARNVLGTVMAA